MQCKREVERKRKACCLVVQGLDAATSNRIMEAAKAQQEEMEAEDAAAQSLPGLAQVIINVLPSLFSCLQGAMPYCMVVRPGLGLNSPGS